MTVVGGEKRGLCASGRLTQWAGAIGLVVGVAGPSFAKVSAEQVLKGPVCDVQMFGIEPSTAMDEPLSELQPLPQSHISSQSPFPTARVWEAVLKYTPEGQQWRAFVLPSTPHGLEDHLVERFFRALGAQNPSLLSQLRVRMELLVQTLGAPPFSEEDQVFESAHNLLAPKMPVGFAGWLSKWVGPLSLPALAPIRKDEAPSFDALIRKARFESDEAWQDLELMIHRSRQADRFAAAHLKKSLDILERAFAIAQVHEVLHQTHRVDYRIRWVEAELDRIDQVIKIIDQVDWQASSSHHEVYIQMRKAEQRKSRLRARIQEFKTSLESF